MSYRILNYKSINPILLASGPLSSNANAINYWHRKGIELVVTKTICGTKTNNGNIYNTSNYTFNRDGFSNLSIDEWCSELMNTEREKVIASIMGNTPEEIVSYCKKLQKIGVNKFELCFSCSNFDSEPLCYDLKKLERYCNYIRTHVSSLISVKVVLSLSRKMNIDMARTIKYCGMNAITISDTLPAILLDNHKNIMFDGIGGISGNFLKPIVMKALYDIRDVAIEKIAVGGVENWHDIDDYISIGANIVGVCSGLMRNGGKIYEEV